MIPPYFFKYRKTLIGAQFVKSLTFTLVFILGNQLLGQDTLEIRILDCLKDKANQLQIDIFDEFKNYEDYLVSEGYLKDKTGMSYYKIYEEIVDKGDVEIYRDYVTNNKLDSLSREDFGHCYYKFRNTKVFDRSQSKYKKLTIELEKARPDKSREYNPVAFAASIYLKVLVPEDFENPIFKYSALYFLYFGAYDLAWKD